MSDTDPSCHGWREKKSHQLRERTETKHNYSIMSNRRGGGGGFQGFDDDDKYGKAKKQGVKGSPPVHHNR